MAIPKIKATYALDPETVRALERMARRWKISKSEAVRRAIRAAAAEGAVEGTAAVSALDQLQRSLALTVPAARRWAEAIRSERKETSRRRRTDGR